MVDKTNNKIVQEELDRRQKEYLNNEEIMEIGEHCKTEKVSLKVDPGASEIDLLLHCIFNQQALTD